MRGGAVGEKVEEKNRDAVTVLQNISESYRQSYLFRDGGVLHSNEKIRTISRSYSEFTVRLDVDQLAVHIL